MCQKSTTESLQQLNKIKKMIFKKFVNNLRPKKMNNSALNQGVKKKSYSMQHCY